MKEQLLLLEQLQRHDANLQELEKTLAAIPEKLKTMRGQLARVEQMLEGARAELAETERWHANQESALQSETELTQKAKQKLNAVRNTKEFMASQREMDATRRNTEDREQEVAKAQGVLEEYRKRIATQEADVEVLRKEIEREEGEANTQMADLKSQIAASKAEREGLLPGIRADLLRKYASIRMRRGLAIVAVRNGTCYGCNMNIPPQLYNTLQRGSSLETCPNCHRLIYWDRLMETVQQDAQTPAASPPLGDR